MSTTANRSTLALEPQGVPSDPFTSAVCRARAEFLEMPGLRVTLAQAQRLLGLDRPMCEAVLNSLVGSRFLAVSGPTFIRAD